MIFNPYLQKKQNHEAKIILIAYLFISSSVSKAQGVVNKPIVKSNKETIMNESSHQICLVDKFFVPKKSLAEFTEKMDYNRNFIKNLKGFVISEAYQQIDSNGNLTIMTITSWENQDALKKQKV